MTKNFSLRSLFGSKPKPKEKIRRIEEHIIASFVCRNDVIQLHYNTKTKTYLVYRFGIVSGTYPLAHEALAHERFKKLVIQEMAKL